MVIPKENCFTLYHSYITSPFFELSNDLPEELWKSLDLPEELSSGYGVWASNGHPSSAVPTETQTKDAGLENLYVDPCDNGIPQGNYDEANHDENGLQQVKLIPVPEKGKKFSSEEEAYEYYKKYAQQNGFSIRKGKVNRLANGTIRKRYLYCSREGIRSTKSSSNKIKKFQKRETRTGCKANIQLRVVGGMQMVDLRCGT